MGVRPSRGRETGGAPTPALIVPGSQSSSYDPWRSISFLSSKLSQRSPRPTKSSARALLVPPIEPRPRPAGHHSVRLLGTPEDPILGVVLVVRREICPGSRLDTPLLFPALRGGYIKGERSRPSLSARNRWKSLEADARTRTGDPFITSNAAGGVHRLEAAFKRVTDAPSKGVSRVARSRT